MRLLNTYMLWVLIKTLFVIMWLLFLSGCCSLCPTKIDTVYIKTGCSPPPVVVSPEMKTANLTSESTTKETVEALVFDLLSTKEYANQLNIALKPYASCTPTK